MDDAVRSAYQMVKGGMQADDKCWFFHVRRWATKDYSPSYLNPTDLAAQLLVWKRLGAQSLASSDTAVEIEGDVWHPLTLRSGGPTGGEVADVGMLVLAGVCVSGQTYYFRAASLRDEIAAFLRRAFVPQ